MTTQTEEVHRRAHLLRLTCSLYPAVYFSIIGQLAAGNKTIQNKTVYWVTPGGSVFRITSYRLQTSAFKVGRAHQYQTDFHPHHKANVCLIGEQHVSSFLFRYERGLLHADDGNTSATSPVSANSGLGGRRYFAVGTWKNHENRYVCETRQPNAHNQQ
jgi:hypothetical protein